MFVAGHCESNRGLVVTVDLIIAFCCAGVSQVRRLPSRKQNGTVFLCSSMPPSKNPNKKRHVGRAEGPTTLEKTGGERSSQANDFPGQVSFHTGERNKCRLHHQVLSPKASFGANIRVSLTVEPRINQPQFFDRGCSLQK